MTKVELIKKIDEINGLVEDAITSVNGLRDELKDIISQLESLPEEPDEITD